MEVILLERVGKLGQIGDVVRVKNGFARNFLLPQGKALRATKENRTRFEGMKAELESKNAERKGLAEAASKKLDGQTFVLLRQAGEGGQLYGSVSTRDIAAEIAKAGFPIDRNQIVLNIPIKTIGLKNLKVALHPEIVTGITVNVARSADEAVRQARGEDLTVKRTDDEEKRAQARVDAGKMFEKAPEGEESEAPAEEGEKKPRAKRAKAPAGEGDAAGEKPAGAKKEKKAKE
jgi:large subunit ribosomal protein L9